MSQLMALLSEREFGAIFGKLAIQLRWQDADEVAIRSYYDALKDCPIDFVREAAESLARERGRKYFPTTGEWRDAIEVIRKRTDNAAAAEPRAWTVECEACDDCGWERFECTGDNFCGRQKKHLPHAFVRPCACRATNRTYQRHHNGVA